MGGCSGGNLLASNPVLFLAAQPLPARKNDRRPENAKHPATGEPTEDRQCTDNDCGPRPGWAPGRGGSGAMKDHPFAIGLYERMIRYPQLNVTTGCSGEESSYVEMVTPE